MPSRPATLRQHPLDRLARRLATPMPRRRALGYGGAALTALAVPALRPPFASAQEDGSQVCAAATEDCFEITCPPNTICCLGPDDPATVTPCHTNPHCCDPCDPDGATCLGDGYCGPGKIADHCFCEDHRRCGSECCGGDDVACCDRLFTFKSAFCCTEDELDKETCKDGKYGAAVAGVALGVGAVLTGGALAVAIGLAAGAAGAGGVAFDICADDPPDPDFRALYPVRMPRVARIRSGRGITPAGARAVRRLVVNQLRFAVHGYAWIRSIEKAQGAALAGDADWERRQREAAAKHALTAAEALEEDLPLRRAAARHLRRAGHRGLEVKASQVKRFQREVAREGLPPATERMLRQARFSEARIAALREDLIKADPKAVARLGPFGETKDPRFAQLNARMAERLRASAVRLRAA